MENDGILNLKQLNRHRDRVFSLIQNRLLKEFWTSKRLVDFEKRTKNVESIKFSANEIADNIMEAVENGQ